MMKLVSGNKHILENSAIKADQIFFLYEIIFLVLLVGFLFLFKMKGPTSHFKVRESDRVKEKKLKENLTQLPHLPTGINIQGSPHEILGVSHFSTREEIQKAFKNLMKIYHPDRIVSFNSKEWEEAQKITRAIIQAKEILLKNLR